MSSLNDNYYDGSRFFVWITEYSGIPIDQVNFVITELVALCLSPLFRTIFHPSKTKPQVRHAFGLVIGLFIGYFAFGKQAFHLAGLPAVCYVVIRTQSPHTMQRTVLAVAMFYLSCIHIHRQVYDYGSLTLDITGPLMVVTQKVSSLAYSIHDGFTRKEEELTKNQKYYAVSKIPSALEYFSYVFQFQVIMAGPTVFYRDYIEFINGHNFLKYPQPSDVHLDRNSNSKKVIIEPSPSSEVTKKILSSILCAIFFATFLSSFPVHRIKDDDFVEGKTVLYQLGYLSIATVLIRFKYYHAWLFSDAVCNLAGLGFSGYNNDGTSRWDLISNVDILGFELGLSFRESIEHWNKGTNTWLRLIMFERFQKHGTLLTYALSAFWHGFYPGYYLTFASGALFTFASRAVRRAIRPFFQGTQAMKTFYDFMTLLATRVVMTYITFSFVILEFWPSVRLYMHMYFVPHIMALAAILLLPRLFPQPANKRAHLRSPLADKLSEFASNEVTSGVHG